MSFNFLTADEKRRLSYALVNSSPMAKYPYRMQQELQRILAITDKFERTKKFKELHDELPADHEVAGYIRHDFLWEDEYANWLQPSAPPRDPKAELANDPDNPINIKLRKMQADYRQEFRAVFENKKQSRPANISERLWEAQQEDLFESSLKQSMPTFRDAQSAYHAERNEWWQQERKNNHPLLQ